MRWAGAVTPELVAAETFGDGVNTAEWRAGFLEDTIILSLRKASGLELSTIADAVGTAAAAAVAEVRKLRHHFGPFPTHLSHFSALCRLTRTV